MISTHIRTEGFNVKTTIFHQLKHLCSPRFRIHGKHVYKYHPYKSVYRSFHIKLTLNVPGNCGSSRPTRVEPRLHCVGIEWQMRGRCVGSAAHSPLRAIAARALSVARAIEPRPTHFARVRALGVPRTHNAAHALRVGPRTLRGSAHFAWAPRILRGIAYFATRALGGPYIDIILHAIFNPFNLLSTQITPNII